MKLDVSPQVYLALCGLVRDALEVESDAAPLLRHAATQLSSVLDALDEQPDEIVAHADAISELRETAQPRRAIA